MGASGRELLWMIRLRLIEFQILVLTLYLPMPMISQGAQLDLTGALLVQTGKTNDTSFHHAPGDWSDEDVSIEIWFKPDNINPTPANGQILFEDGGGTGMGLYIDGNLLRARKAGGGTPEVRTTT